MKRSLMILAAGLWFTAPAVGQDVEPQTVPLRIDNTGHASSVEIAIRCGNVSRHVGSAEPNAITELRVRVTHSCGRGLLMAETEVIGWNTPLDEVVRYERKGQLAGLMLCMFEGRASGLRIYSRGSIPNVCR